MPTWKVTLEYEGTRYAGWQEQPRERTVAGELRGAARRVFGEAVEVGGAGRTDAGVHALAQVAHLRAKKRPRTPRGLEIAINDGLPSDIHVLSVEPAHDRWHARHDATLRSYIYQFSRRRSAFLKPFVWWVRDDLNLDRMRQAAALLVGMHDFASFADLEDSGDEKSTKVRVFEATLEEAGPLILFRFVASHFLRKMVRRVAGVLARVGTGAMQAGEVGMLLASGRGNVAEWTAPPSGLFLEQVFYGKEKLPALRPAVIGGTDVPGKP
ncbi:MAG: tRNA pseudouridine(38-40) synthase TruA [Planctomycetota bacterium]